MLFRTAALTFALVFASITPERADYNGVDPPDAHRLVHWFVTFIDDQGQKAVAQDALRKHSGSWRDASESSHTRMRLIKFRNRSDVDEFLP